MKDIVFVLNCGSSSVKFALLNPCTQANICSGVVENIGAANAKFKYKHERTITEQQLSNITYEQALHVVTRQVKSLGVSFCAIGHRVVHGGEKFTHSVIIDKTVLKSIRQCISLAPLHNPANLLGIKHTLHVFPKCPQIAVFDTAFHQSLPQRAYIYPLPYMLYKKHKIRRYGFHGTSHRFVAERAALALQKPLAQCALITAHLGNGCSVTAIHRGKSIDTSMGLTPLEGLVMGTRSGDVDPGLHQYLVDNCGYDLSHVTKMLNSQSGLLGVSGISNDMRVIEKQAKNGSRLAILALEIFCYRLAKYIAALFIPLTRLDALVFTGGIGENSAVVRQQTLNWLKVLGFKVAKKHNLQHGQNNRGIITCGNGPKALVIPTNEELLIAEDARNLVKS